MKRTKIAIMLVLGLLIGLLAINGTISYLSDGEDVTNVFSVGDIEVKLTEPGWDPDDDTPWYPGDVREKNPTAEAVSGDVYFRMKVEIVGLLDSDDADLVWNTIYYDEDGDLVAGTTDLTLAELQADFPHFNPDEFTAIAATGSSDLVKYFLYTDGGANAAVLAEGESATLFTTIVIPADYGNDQFEKLGDEYSIKVSLEAIQAQNIAAADAAGVLADTFDD